MTSSVKRSKTGDLPAGISVHVGAVDTLLSWADCVSSPTELVIAPVELHRRNLKLRLTDADRPLDAFEFTGPASVASRLLETSGRSANSLNRVDRLALLGDILASDHEARDRFRMVLGGDPADNGKAVEQARTELEATTNYHPGRVDAFRQTVETVPSPVDDDAGDVLAGTLAVERALRRQSSKATSDRAVIRRATRVLTEIDGTVWSDAFPNVERVSVVGLSNVPAPLVDLVNAITATCDVEVHWFLRRGTGSFLKPRLAELLSIPDPGQVVVT